MNTKAKSSAIKKNLVLLCLLGLGGCGGLDLPHVFSGDEVPEGAKNEPRLVGEPFNGQPQSSKVWPRLGDVPSHPKDFSSPDSISASMTTLENNRNDAVTERQSIVAQDPIVSAPSKP